MTPYAVDSNVVSEILLGGPRASEATMALEAAFDVGIVASVWVLAEILAVAPEHTSVPSVFDDMGIAIDYEVSHNVLRCAARSWRSYLDRRRREQETFSCPLCGAQQADALCTSCGHRIRGPRRILADFLIGAHATKRAQALITWDRGVYATYFPALTIVSPSSTPG